MNIDLNRGMPQIPPHAPYILIVPGVGLAVLGILVFFNHALVQFLVGGMLLLVGMLLTFVGWRLLQRMK
jgi:hypothetical protein